LTAAGIAHSEHRFTAHTIQGAVSMSNVIAEIPGTEPGVIIIGNHYDTKLFHDFEFVGANDGGSTTAWMIELARAIGPRREGHTLLLCWFDGEEAFGEWSDTDGLYGSREFVANLHAEGRLGDIRTMINVDMIGDCMLNVHKDSGAPTWLARLIWDAAGAAGHGRAFTSRRISIDDDHLPFRNAGIPSIDLIDFQYGGGNVEHQMNWHTPRDTIELVCADSLQAVGDVILVALPRLDAALRGAQTE
jgi:Zn-dependent M28 family amino/carboxypeptidase